MNNIARQFHQTAMDIYDLGKIYQAKGQPEIYFGNLALAFWLDKEAAVRVQSENTDVLWKAVYARSAGWLAYKNEKYIEAKQLAELGLLHRAAISPEEVAKLTDLLSTTENKISQLKLSEHTLEGGEAIIGIVFSANVHEKVIHLKQSGVEDFIVIQVAEEDILQTARLYLGEFVNAEVAKSADGSFKLLKIQRAA